MMTEGMANKRIRTTRPTITYVGKKTVNHRMILVASLRWNNAKDVNGYMIGNAASHDRPE